LSHCVLPRIVLWHHHPCTQGVLSPDCSGLWFPDGGTTSQILSEQECSRFWYGGCSGNENRFWTQKECENRCPTKTPGRRGDDRGSCKNYTIMWFFDNSLGRCSRFWYGGCGGNENRFWTQKECENRCPTKTPGRRGDFWIPVLCLISLRFQLLWPNECSRFWYGGCGGNGNRFKTQQECENLCLTRGTETLQINFKRNHKTVLSCNLRILFQIYCSPKIRV
uniref:BPTI/Kunitz inhibitor domain-containing protein n=1 Tax=Lates calcarifer TaxID=8187 RepID=A0A4W6DQ37_LATCA